MSTKVTTGKIRLSYLNVVTARAMSEDETPKFSTAILIPKKINGKENPDLSKIATAVAEAKEVGKTKKWGGKIPPTLKLPLRDGDEEHPEDEAYKGHFFLNASNTRKPILLDTDKRPLEKEDSLYSGAYARVAINFFPFAGKSKGVAVSLESILKLEDGESLGGGIVTYDDAVAAFSDDEDDLL